MTDGFIEGHREFTIATRYLLGLPEKRDGGPLPLVLALHGQGMSAEGFARILRHLPDSPRALLVPEGMYPLEMRSVPSRGVGHAWYIYRGDQEEFRGHLERSEKHLLGVIDDVAGRDALDPARSVILGFSQGGYLAGYVALRHPERFAGLILASARLKHEFLEREIERGPLPATLFLLSREDRSLPWERLEEGVELLRRAGGDVEVFLHDAGHRLPPAALHHAGEWLRRKGLDGGTRA